MQWDPQKRLGNTGQVHYYNFLSAFLRNWFLCWNHWNGDVTPTLEAALLCSYRAGSDLGHESGLV